MYIKSRYVVKQTILLSLIIHTLICYSAYATEDDEFAMFGEYSDKPILKPSDKPNLYILENNIKFTEKSGLHWGVEKGLVTDCASIPEFAWEYIGIPCTEEFKAPAIVHDRYSNEGVRDEKIPFRTVHDMFYFALRANGVEKLKSRIIWAAVRFFGPRWKSSGEDSKWLFRYGREYLKTGGEIHFVSKDNNRSIAIEVVTDSTKLEKQRYDTDWFRRYVDWLEQTENEPFAVLQSAADMCDAIGNDAPGNSFPVFDPEIEQIDIKAEKINPASMQLARSLNAIKNSKDTVFSEIQSLFNMYGNVDETYHRIGHHIGDEFHCPNLDDTIKTFGVR